MAARELVTGAFLESPVPPRLPVDNAPRVIGILGFDGVATLDFIGPLEAFRAARNYDNYHQTHACYEVVILGLTNKTFISESGVVFKADKTLDRISALDTLVIPGGNGSRSPEVRRFVSTWLRRHEERVRRIASVCTGIYPLAESGLADGREIVAHWRCAREGAQCKSVAEAVGFKSADAFRRAFERQLKVGPTSFRMRFQRNLEKHLPVGCPWEDQGSRPIHHAETDDPTAKFAKCSKRAARSFRRILSHTYQARAGGIQGRPKLSFFTS